MFDWLRRHRKEHSYFLIVVTFKRIYTKDELKPFELFEETKLVKARNHAEAQEILEHYIMSKNTSYCLYIIETYKHFDKALSND